jgi:hypothetical protein
MQNLPGGGARRQGQDGHLLAKPLTERIRSPVNIAGCYKAMLCNWPQGRHKSDALYSFDFGFDHWFCHWRQRR